jgi:hypothetical protein
MNAAAKEILNRFGEKPLSVIQKDFPNGFHIIGGDENIVIVGDRVMNRSYSRKNFRVKETYRF